MQQLESKFKDCQGITQKRLSSVMSPLYIWDNTRMIFLSFLVCFAKYNDVTLTVIMNKYRRVKFSQMNMSPTTILLLSLCAINKMTTKNDLLPWSTCNLWWGLISGDLFIIRYLKVIEFCWRSFVIFFCGQCASGLSTLLNYSVISQNLPYSFYRKKMEVKDSHRKNIVPISLIKTGFSISPSNV